jgi:hypothetical protein
MKKQGSSFATIQEEWFGGQGTIFYLMRLRDEMARRALRIRSSFRSTSCFTASPLGLCVIVFSIGSTKESKTETASQHHQIICNI